MYGRRVEQPAFELAIVTPTSEEDVLVKHSILGK